MIQEPIPWTQSPSLKPVNEYSEGKLYFFLLGCEAGEVESHEGQGLARSHDGSPSARRKKEKNLHIEEMRSDLKTEKSEKGREKEPKMSLEWPNPACEFSSTFYLSVGGTNKSLFLSNLLCFGFQSLSVKTSGYYALACSPSYSLIESYFSPSPPPSTLHDS